MAENKKSFILYADIIAEIIEHLPRETKGDLLQLIVDFVNDKNPEPTDVLLKTAFAAIRLQLKRDLVKWREEKGSRSEAGKKGMASKWGKSEHAIARSERLSNARSIATHTKLEWEKLIELCDYRCVICRNEDIVKDHIKPIYQGGSDGINNLQPLCKSCNSSKGADSTNHVKVYIDKMPINLQNAYQSLTNITANVNVNVNEKEEVSPTKVFRIEECLTVALNDPRWVKANKATREGLEKFNAVLEERGVYEKNPADYKTHYANYKRTGKLDNGPPGVTSESINDKIKKSLKEHAAN